MGGALDEMSEVMREYVSSKYGGRWREKVAKMPDYQVASIYHRMLDKEEHELRERARNQRKDEQNGTQNDGRIENR